MPKERPIPPPNVTSDETFLPWVERYITKPSASYVQVGSLPEAEKLARTQQQVISIVQSYRDLGLPESLIQTKALGLATPPNRPTSLLRR